MRRPSRPNSRGYYAVRPPRGRASLSPTKSHLSCSSPPKPYIHTIKTSILLFPHQVLIAEPCLKMAGDSRLRKLFNKLSVSRKSRSDATVPLPQPLAELPGQRYFPVPVIPADQQRSPRPGVVCNACMIFFHWIQAADRAAEAHTTGPLGSERFHYSRYEAWEAGLAQGCELCCFLFSICAGEIQAILQDNRRPVLSWLDKNRESLSNPARRGVFSAHLATEDSMFRGVKGISIRLLRVDPEQGKALPGHLSNTALF